MITSKKTVAVCIMLVVYATCTLAQGNISKQRFDVLWNKADSMSKNGTNITKSLNAIEQEKINAIDLQEKKPINKNYKPIDTSNLDMFSTKPIFKGATKEDIKPKQAKIILPAKTSEKTKTTTTPVQKTKVETKQIETKNKLTETKPAVNKQEDFSTKPIVKGKEVETQRTTQNANQQKKSKYDFDTTKNFREFTFDTKPIVNNNASYSRKDEPLPKSKAQIEDEIPVNRKPSNTNINSNNTFLKEAYASYDKEADSLHTANKKRLDSIMQALNIKVPIVINSNEYIDIFVSGGGTLKNNDSKQYDRIFLQNNGVIQREYKTKNEGVQRSEKKISKDELSKLAQYMVDMNFLDFNSIYDCADDNDECNQRFSKSPQPIPLEISLTVGQKKNTIKVSIYDIEFGKNLVNYPPNLEKIMKAIYTIVGK